ncbi:carbohydrate-binding protein [Embleya sp. NPDC059259]
MVSYQGHTYRAKWWTQGEVPGTTGQWGVWVDLGAC